jgi:hypothetical protein
VEAREIVESYRWGRIELPRWPQRLRYAAAALRSAKQGGLDAEVGMSLDVLADELLALATGGLAGRSTTLARLSEHLEALVLLTRPAGFPRPGQHEVSF